MELKFKAGYQTKKWFETLSNSDFKKIDRGDDRGTDEKSVAQDGKLSEIEVAQVVIPEYYDLLAQVADGKTRLGEAKAQKQDGKAERLDGRISLWDSQAVNYEIVMRELGFDAPRATIGMNRDATPLNYENPSAIPNHRDQYAAELYNKGLCHLESRDFTFAKEQLEDALRLNPNDPNTLLALGHTLASLRKVDEAIGYIQQARVVDPENQYVNYYLGSAFEQKSIASFDSEEKAAYLTEAISCYSQAVAENPVVKATASLDLVRALQNNNQPDAALAAIDIGLEGLSKSDREWRLLYREKAGIYQSQGNEEEFLAALEASGDVAYVGQLRLDYLHFAVNQQIRAEGHLVDGDSYAISQARQLYESALNWATTACELEEVYNRMAIQKIKDQNLKSPAWEPLARDDRRSAYGIKRRFETILGIPSSDYIISQGQAEEPTTRTTY